MERSSVVVVAAVFLASVMGGEAFNAAKGSVRQKTSLDAMPPMIIGPIIKKMREQKEKDNQPMYKEDEAKGQAPGLRVGADTWRWPPVWPYDGDMFKQESDIKEPDSTEQLKNMAGMLQGMPQVPTPDEIELEDDTPQFDAFQYWGEEVADEKTELDAEAAQKLKE